MTWRTVFISEFADIMSVTSALKKTAYAKEMTGHLAFHNQADLAFLGYDKHLMMRYLNFAPNTMQLFDFLPQIKEVIPCWLKNHEQRRFKFVITKKAVNLTGFKLKRKNILLTLFLTITKFPKLNLRKTRHGSLTAK